MILFVRLTLNFLTYYMFWKYNMHIHESGLRPWTWLICRALCWPVLCLACRRIGAFFLVVASCLCLLSSCFTVVCFKWKIWKSGSSWRNVAGQQTRYVAVKTTKQGVTVSMQLNLLIAAACLDGHIGYTMFVVLSKTVSCWMLVDAIMSLSYLICSSTVAQWMRVKFFVMR